MVPDQLPGPVTVTTLTVVGADLGPVPFVAIQILVELRRILDLVLRSVHVDALVADVDTVDHAGRQEHLLAEDPRAGVHDEIAAAGVVRGLAD